MFFKLLLGVWMSAVIVAAFLFLPAAKGFAEPETARIVVFHVPNAMIAVVAFVMAMAYGIAYLRTGDLRNDAKSSVAAELGLVFAALATVTGAFFAQRQWGSWWVPNDVRETSIVVLLLIYMAYFALRQAVESPEKRASLSAVYAILAVLPMLFLTFVLPRMVYSLHPANTLSTKHGLSTDYRIVLGAAMLGFTGLFVWLFRIKTALSEFRLNAERSKRRIGK